MAAIKAATRALHLLVADANHILHGPALGPNDQLLAAGAIVTVAGAAAAIWGGSACDLTDLRSTLGEGDVVTAPMSDGDLLTLCVLQEAGNQLPDGMAAEACVVLTRIRHNYASNGTILGHDQISWTEFAMKGEVYRRVATYGAQASLMVGQGGARGVGDLSARRVGGLRRQLPRIGL